MAHIFTGEMSSCRVLRIRDKYFYRGLLHAIITEENHSQYKSPVSIRIGYKSFSMNILAVYVC